MYFAITLAILLLSAGIYNLVVAIWGSFPSHQLRTVGTLVKANSQKNLHTRYGFVPVWTDCVYVYQVNGKSYRFRTGKRMSKRDILKKVTIVYVKGFPRRAGIAEYRSFEACVLAAALCLLGAFMLGAAIFL